MESKLREHFLYQDSRSVLGGMAVGARQLELRESEPTPEQWEEIKAKRLNEEKEMQRRNVACTIVSLAEVLVMENACTVPEAFETAKELYAESRLFVDSYKLPE